MINKLNLTLFVFTLFLSRAPQAMQLADKACPVVLSQPLGLGGLRQTGRSAVVVEIQNAHRRTVGFTGLCSLQQKVKGLLDPNRNPSFPDELFELVQSGVLYDEPGPAA